jgi:hypothetical protein
MKHRIEFNSDPPDYSGLNFLNHDWSTNYPGAQEDRPNDTPPSKTEEVFITCYVDASHGYELITRQSVTGILICVNRTPVKWLSKRQNTVESSTYGSELVAAQTVDGRESETWNGGG